MFDLAKKAIAASLASNGVISLQSELGVRHLDTQGKPVMRPVLFGLLGSKPDERHVVNKSVTTAFVDFVTDQLQTETSAFGDFKYHDSGISTTGENITDVGLGTACGESRDTGTQTENAHNIYESVATHTYAGPFAITEHGLFNASSGVTLMDRTVFSAVNVTAGEKIEFTYRLTLTAGG